MRRKAEQLGELSSFDANRIGLDIEDFDGYNKYIKDNKIHLIKNDVNSICIRDNAVDTVICRSVLEHLENPLRLFEEVNLSDQRSEHLEKIASRAI